MVSTARSIELPDPDETVEALPEAARRAIGAHWLGRASAELSVAISFEALLPRLRGVRAADVVVALAVKAIEDERRHGELCVRLASRYLGRPIEPPKPRDGALPDFGTGDEDLEVALVVLGMCCINESIASEWIRSSWKVATSPTALHANRAHLHDEIDHARLGWAHLGSSAVGDRTRRQLRSWIPKIVDANVREWKRADAHLPAEGIPAHGHLSAADSAEVVDAAVRDVVVPGLAHLGLADSVPGVRT